MARLARNYAAGDKQADKAEARKWYEMAANANHVPSMRRLADMYTQGEGGPRDLARARSWLELAWVHASDPRQAFGFSASLRASYGFDL